MVSETGSFDVKISFYGIIQSINESYLGKRHINSILAIYDVRESPIISLVFIKNSPVPGFKCLLGFSPYHGVY